MQIAQRGTHQLMQPQTGCVRELEHEQQPIGRCSAPTVNILQRARRRRLRLRAGGPARDRRFRGSRSCLFGPRHKGGVPREASFQTCRAQCRCWRSTHSARIRHHAARVARRGRLPRLVTAGRARHLTLSSSASMRMGSPSCTSIYVTISFVPAMSKTAASSRLIVT